MSHAAELAKRERFSFGQNWSKFLTRLNEERIHWAERSLAEMLGLESLAGKTFLDVGSGSGLFSLAARRLGAEVRSFDYDPASVACTAELRRRYFPDDDGWTVEEGSALDSEYMNSLGRFDIVYSWGVLHHTGAMWEALGNVAPMVKVGGRLFLAIYNDQGAPSHRWTKIKRAYVAAPGLLKLAVLLPAFGRLWGPTMLRDLLKGRPFHTWRNYGAGSGRGMDPWRDVVDWVGGYPFEVAQPEQIFDFFRTRGFELQKLKTCRGGVGCNEFVFSRKQAE